MSVAKNVIQRYGLTTIIGSIAAGAAALLGIETEWGQKRIAPPSAIITAAKPEEINLLPPFSLPPIDPTFKESVERPLFAATRRPMPPATTPVAAAPTMQKGQFRLVGTSVSSESAIALLIDNKTGKTLRAKKGDDVRPGDATIKVDQVTPTQVVLRQGTETEELGLRTATSPAPGATGAIGTRPGMSASFQGGAPQVAGGPQENAGPATPTNPMGFTNGFPTPPSGVQGTFPGGIPMPGGQGATPMPLPPGQFAGAGAPLPPLPPGMMQPSLPGAANQPATGIDPALQRRRRFQNPQSQPQPQ